MLSENIRLALKSIWAHKLRSFLTLSSIIIGVVCIVVMTSLATSGLKTLTRTIDSMGGSRIIFLFRYRPEKMRAKADLYFTGLKQSDYDILKHSLPYLEMAVPYNVHRKQDIYRQGDKKRWNLAILESDNSFLAYFGMKIAKGRTFLSHEIAQHSQVCLIGSETAQILFGHEDAVGQELIYKEMRLTVIGVLKKNLFFGMNFGYSWNDLVIVPMYSLSPELDEILLKTTDSRYNPKVLDIVNAILLKRHNGVDDFRFVDMSTFLDKFYQTFLIIKLVVAAVAGVSLLIGGIGVMNIMLVSISERTHEIGLRKALGASAPMIIRQFLIESTILGCIGGLIGTGIAIGICLIAFQIIPHFLDTWISTISEWAILAALSATLLIGIGFGYYPAQRAAALDPIQALRRK